MTQQQTTFVERSSCMAGQKAVASVQPGQENGKLRIRDSEAKESIEYLAN